jgi:hypothetical protein
MDAYYEAALEKVAAVPAERPPADEVSSQIVNVSAPPRSLLSWIAGLIALRADITDGYCNNKIF